MRRAIVSGITGHLGREVGRQLIEAGIEVHGLTRQSGWNGEPGVLAGRCHCLDGRTETIVEILNCIQPDIVFHLAALARREHRTSDVVPFIDANILLGTQLLESMRFCTCRRFVTAGSYLQHFDTDGSRAFNFYAATKLAFEDMLAYYAEAFDFSAVRLTLCDIYSESDTRRKLMTDIVAAWADRATLKLRSNEVWVDLIHVEDAARAFLQAAYLLENGSIPPGALFHYSISSERDISATELIALFECLGGRKITVERNHNGGSSRTMRPWRGITLPGWEPRVTIEDGIVRILEKLQECEG